jgi:ribulose kinase
VPQDLETTALGAAMVAAVAGGFFADLQEATNAAVSIKEYIEPNSTHRQIYDDAYATYREVYAALQEPFRTAAERSICRGDGELRPRGPEFAKDENQSLP